MTSKSIRDSIEESRKELLDLSFRNPLLNYRSLRARGVEIVGESSDQVFETLVTDGKPMSFLARQDDDDPDTESWEAGLPLYLEADQTDRRLQTRESSANLQKRLLTTYRFANTTIEETGVNTLFLALGMLRWYEADQSQQERLSPLILVPVRLERQGVREQFRVEYNGEDLGSNLSLIEKARSDFGILLPGPVEIEQVAEGTIGVSDYFDLVAERVRQSRLERWIVDPDSIALGFFAYNKLLMYQDLDVAAWPKGERIEDNEIVIALYRDGFSEPAQGIPDDAHLDDHLRPQDTYHVLDADSSQSLAILDAIAGRNMVIQGPPGTGKSQTITNIIAEAVGRGKRVLFVAEKMAALEVVKRRLDNIGLGDTCLELHSHKTNKRETLAELGRVLNLKSQTIGSMEIEDTLSNLLRTRSQLNDYAAAVNTSVGASGVTPNDAFGRLLTPGLAATGSPNPISWPHVNDISNWTGADFTRKREVIEDLRLRLQRSGVPSLHPFWGSRLRTLLPDARTGLETNLDATLSCLETLTSASNNLADTLHLRHPEDVSAAAVLLMAAKLALDAPDTSGLKLDAPHWESNGGQIWSLVELGVQWQRMRRERIGAAESTLEALTDTSGALADILRLNHPANTAEATDLLAAATHSLNAPNTDGLDLAAPQWESHDRQICLLLTQGLQWRQMRSEYDHLLLPQAWDTDFQRARLALNTDGRSFLKRLFSSSYKQARGQLAAVLRGKFPREIDQQIALIDAISAEQQLRAEINGKYADVTPALGRLWNKHNTDWEAIEPAIRWWLKVLADVAADRVPRGAVQLLQKLRVRPDADALQVRIDALGSIIDRYQICARELEEVLRVDYEEGNGDPYRMDALSFDQQRRFISQLSNQSLAGNDGTAIPGEQAASVRRQSPAEAAEKIDHLHSTIGLALGSHWNRYNTDWETIALAVRWWLDMLAEASEGRIVTGVVDLLQSLTVRPAASGSLQEWHARIEELKRALEDYPSRVRGLQSALDMDNQLRFGNPAGLTAVSFQEQRGILSEWSADLPRIQDLVGFNAGAEDALEEGLQPVVSVAIHNAGAAVSLTSWFERAWYESVVETAFAERPTLRDFDTQVHESRIERFKELDRQSQLDNVTRVTMTHMEGPSRLNDMPQRLNRVSTYDSDSEATQRRRQEQLRFLRREIAKRSRHKPIRQLVQQAGEIIQELKPVFMMSPLSIATYLAPGSVKFDLLIFDEASQVRPVDAFGALLRTQKAVVVGDSRQLPPTSFFDRAAQSDDSDDQSETRDIESVLGMFNSKGAPERHLHWHYRSRHESLIAVSNREFYDNRLMVFPSPHTDRDAIGLRFHYLPNAVYDRGRSGVNRVEAEAVAQAVMEHAARHPELSLGVAAFGIRQAEAIQDQVELLRRMDDSREAFFAAHPDEPFFVKNLENVQGDERDVIFISIGYGRDETGQVKMNFGPLNRRDGGERRLNVLITRAEAAMPRVHQSPCR